MNIRKKPFTEALNENRFSIEVYKNSLTGNLEYRDPSGKIVKIADKEGLAIIEQQLSAGLPVVSDGLTITGNGTLASPLVAAGGSDYTETIVKGRFYKQINSDNITTEIYYNNTTIPNSAFNLNGESGYYSNESWLTLGLDLNKLLINGKGNTQTKYFEHFKGVTSPIFILLDVDTFGTLSLNLFDNIENYTGYQDEINYFFTIEILS
jgi:hypothetical protein